MALEPAKTKQGYPQATPYRESKLTMLLIDSLSSGKAALVANCSPLRSHAEETVQTLEFARKANAVKAKPRLHLDPQDQLIEDLRAQLSKCRKENQLLRVRFAPLKKKKRKIMEPTFSVPNDSDTAYATACCGRKLCGRTVYRSQRGWGVLCQRIRREKAKTKRPR